MFSSVKVLTSPGTYTGDTDTFEQTYWSTLPNVPFGVQSAVFDHSPIRRVAIPLFVSIKMNCIHPKNTIESIVFHSIVFGVRSQAVTVVILGPKRERRLGPIYPYTGLPPKLYSPIVRIYPLEDH